MLGLKEQCNNVGFHSEWDEKPSEGFEFRNNMI